MVRYISNAFSLNMVQGRFIAAVEPVSVEATRRLLTVDGVVNAIGHVDTDRVVRDLLGVSELSEGERISLSLEPGDDLIVAQYRGPRLPEGATSLPEGATIEFSIVTLIPAMGWEDSVSAYGKAPVSVFDDAEEVVEFAAFSTLTECSVPPAFERVSKSLLRAMFMVRENERVGAL